jgi:hypothetical protein
MTYSKIKVALHPLSRAIITAAAAAVFSINFVHEAAAYECKTIGGRCAVQVGGTCEPRPNGEYWQYWEKGGNVMFFDNCVLQATRAQASGNKKPAQKKK